MTDTALSFLEEFRDGIRELREYQAETARYQAETARQMRESREEAERQMRESREETARQMRESREEAERQMRENREKFDREMRERRAEAEWQMRESREEADRRMEKTDKRIDKLSEQMGGLHNSMGDLIEILIAPHLWEKFGGYPYNLCRGYQRVPIFDEKNKEVAEIDILLSDTEWCMAVEVKRNLREDDIDRHIVRMGRILRYPPAEIVGKKLLGALAGGVVAPEVHKYAHNAGFFVLELRGDNVSLVPPPAGFEPKIW
jgi:hypothetical protein